MEAARCSIEQCDIFDFMAYHVGMTVLHPGGIWATERLAEKCHIAQDSEVLDIGCGKGTSGVYLAKKYHCRVRGVDIEDRLIEQANELARRHGLSRQVQFQTGNALGLPFPANEFEVTLSQALLILVPDKKQAVREAVRVTKPGGFIGWLELSFHQHPPDSLFRKAESSACAFCIYNTFTFDEWQELLEECGMREVQVIRGEMGMRQRRMFRDEGLLNATRIMWKWLFNTRIRKRMNAVFEFFREHSEYIGYGIYVGRKP